MDLLLFVEGCVEVGDGTDKYLDLSTNDDDPEKPPLGIQIAVTNVPTTIGHAEQCNKLLHTILACLNNGYIFNKLHSVGYPSHIRNGNINKTNSEGIIRTAATVINSEVHRSGNFG